MSLTLDGLEWMTVDEALDLLRVSDDNEDIIDAHAATIPGYVEITTGYPATCTQGVNCDETVKALCRFVLQLWFNPDGTDADSLKRTIDSLTASVKALVIAGDLED